MDHESKTQPQVLTVLLEPHMKPSVAIVIVKKYSKTFDRRSEISYNSLVTSGLCHFMFELNRE
jgi:hypothetical protein